MRTIREMDCGIFQTMPIRATELQPAPLSKAETTEDLDGRSIEHKISAYFHRFRLRYAAYLYQIL